MDTLLHDIRYAWRSVVRRPGLSAIAVLTLAVGVGVNAVAFSAINALLFHPFTLAEVDRLGWVMLSAPGNPDGALSWTEFNDLRRSPRSFDAIAAAAPLNVALRVDGHAEQVFAAVVSANYFESIGARPEIGRTLTESDAAGVEIPVVVSHRFWTERLNRSAVAGISLTVDARLVSLVGVMPDTFQGPSGIYAPEMWIPLERFDAFPVAAAYRKSDNRWLGVFARLAPGVGAAQAQTELAAWTDRWKAERPEPPANSPLGVSVLRFHPMRDGHPELRGVRPYAAAMLSIVAIVLLVACANVAALLLTRAAERRREIGMRMALGATRCRLIRGLVIEGVLLACASGAAALLLAAWSERLLAVFALPAPEPQRLHMAIDWRLAGFTGLMVLVAGVLPALLPALHATARGIARSLRVESGFGDAHRSALRSAFVVAQVAGSTLFLAVALLCVRSFVAAAVVNPGFDVDRTIVANLDPVQYGIDSSRTRVVLDTLLERLAASPAIANVAAADRAPFSVGYPLRERAAAPGETCEGSQCRPALTYAVTSGHVEALGMRLVAGRDLTAADVRDRSGVLVSESLAAERWPNGNAIGQVLLVGVPARTVHVVGVVADTRQSSMGESPQPVLYRPLTDEDLSRGFAIIARAARDPRAALVTVRDAIRAAAPNVPPAGVNTMRDRLELPLWPYRTGAAFFVICGTLALLLATVGLFATTYFTVRQRTREFGIRIAIGARPSDILGQVVHEGLRLTVPGAAIGLAGALVAGRLLSRFLLGVSPADPLSFGAALAIQTVVAVVASALPGRRATQTDPMATLRAD